jgi:hypothetical protein
MCFNTQRSDPYAKCTHTDSEVDIENVKYRILERSYQMNVGVKEEQSMKSQSKDLVLRCCVNAERLVKTLRSEPFKN